MSATPPYDITRSPGVRAGDVCAIRGSDRLAVVLALSEAAGEERRARIVPLTVTTADVAGEDDVILLPAHTWIRERCVVETWNLRTCPLAALTSVQWTVDLRFLDIMRTAYAMGILGDGAPGRPFAQELALARPWCGVRRTGRAREAQDAFRQQELRAWNTLEDAWGGPPLPSCCRPR